MSIDMSQFYQVFFDETAEHLASMESLLLALDLGDPDADALNAIFRAAHSIKGGSGTFGFTDMTEVTHVLETLLDRIRKGERRITSEMVDAFLEAGDVLKDLLEAHQQGMIAESGPSVAICEKLERLSAASAPDVAESDAAKPDTALAYTIKFPKNSRIFPDETSFENLLENLKTLGSIEILSDENGRVELSLATAARESELREIFEFFLKASELEINIGHPAPAVPDEAGYGLFVEPEILKAGIEEDQGYGFFVEPEAAKAQAEDAQGYGFFVEVDQPPAAQAEPIPKRSEMPVRKTETAVHAAAETSIRVSVEKVDQMINLVGELVITQSMLAEIASAMDPVVNERLLNGLAQLERNTRELQESVMSVRMMPINFVFSRYPRLVRDLAGKLGKEVRLRMVGEGTELDKGLIEKISDPLTHLVRNSLDHGIEMPADRSAMGKDRQGTITLRAAHQGGNVVVEVTDDGAGLSRERILAKAREKGLPVSDGMSDSEVWLLIFAPGFSTAEVVTDVSGRGVGMDVVKKNIESIGGRVEISSRQGQGSTVTIRLPLTLAILDGLSIAVGEQIYIVPLSFISESLQPGRDAVKLVSGQGQVVQVRGEYLPVIALYKLFNIKPKFTDPAQGILVLLEAEGKKVALFVDDLVGQHQVVIKSLETNYRKVAGVSGATIMGDGRVALIMDVGALVKFAQQ